jgi:hypothetical protein
MLGYGLGGLTQPCLFVDAAMVVKISDANVLFCAKQNKIVKKD